MSKKIILTSAIVLGTIISFSSSAMNVLADQVDNNNTGNTVIAGSEVKKADNTVAINSAIVQASADAPTGTIIESANYATQAQQQAYLNKVVPIAQQVAQKYGVYTSVMLAQSILESNWGISDLATQANNYFGMKGDYNGQSYTIKTREWSADKGSYYITADFRQYPSITASFEDNGNKLRNGLSWNTSYYKGTWKENTKSYQDATAWLQGRYATDNNYATALNNVIKTYNLTQYDGTAQVNSGAQTDTHTIKVRDADGAYVALVAFNNNGQANNVKNRALANDSSWYTDKTKNYNGHTYYRVATNEWVADSYLA